MRWHIVLRYYRDTMISRTSPSRMAMLTGLAAVLGIAGGAAAWVLLKLIGFITSVTVFGHASTTPPSYALLDPGPRLVIVAVLGALVVSLLAKWCPVIRGHGIPE